MAYTLPELPYAYDALEPHIDEVLATRAAAQNLATRPPSCPQQASILAGNDASTSHWAPRHVHQKHQHDRKTIKKVIQGWHLEYHCPLQLSSSGTFFL